MIKGWTICGAVVILGLLFVVEKLHAFTVISNVGRPAAWPNAEVSYYFYDVPAEFQNALHDSFDVWTVINGVDLNITYQGLGTKAAARDGKNTISWVTEKWSELSFRPPSNALAVTLSSFSGSSGEVLDSDIYFNAQNFSWGNLDPGNPDYDLVDVHNVGTHEVGHLLGLDHSSALSFEPDEDLWEATMYYASSRGETFRRSPAWDDELGIRSLYPQRDVDAINDIAASISEEEGEEAGEAYRTEALSHIKAAARIDSVSELSSSDSIVILRVRGQNFSERTSFVLTAYSARVSDSVARYRTIVSSTEAEVRINLGDFTQANAYLLAFNDTSLIDSYPLNVSSFSAFNAANSSSGGGCQISLASSPSHSPLIILALVIGLLFFVRKIMLQSSQKSCQEVF